MSFKKTSEGRVFFQGSERSANDHTGQTQGMQLQILTLLKALNEKLQASQADRQQMQRDLEIYRSLIEGLQTKAERNERAYSVLEEKIGKASSPAAESKAERAEALARETLKELEETRKLLLDLEDRTDQANKNVSQLKGELGETRKLTAESAKKDLAGYENLIKRIQENEHRHDQMSQRVEEAMAVNEKLMRKIDKAVEDRARFMRKIERIEETVLQTREALNAKAMVLLTGQGTGGAASSALDDSSALPPDFAPSVAPDLAPPAARRWHGEVVAVLCVVVASVLAGWLISEVQKPKIPDLQGLKMADRTASPLSEAETDVAAKTSTTALPNEEWQIEEDTAAFAEMPEEAARASSILPPAADYNNDIGAIDLNNQQQLETLLETNPDQLATALNNLEPSSADATAEAGQGFGADPALPEVAKKIEEQALKGVPEAQHDLAAVYTAGHAGIPQNYQRAAYWFEKAAAGGVANASYNLGVLYHQGLGMPANIEKALHWYERAAAQGHPEAQYNLGIAYIEGIGVTYDPFKAATYFENAAKQNVMEAAYNLGLIYENGLLGKPEPDKALTWYKSAADRGSPEAKAALDQLAKTLGIEVGTLVDGIDAGQEHARTATANPQRVLMIEIQKHLIGAGLYPGPADGMTGPLTADAIRSYQTLNALNIDGKPSRALLEHMQAQEGTSAGQ